MNPNEVFEKTSTQDASVGLRHLSLLVAKIQENSGHKICAEIQVGLELPFNSSSPPSPTPLARDASRVGLGILLLYSREEGRAGWQLEGII